MPQIEPLRDDKSITFSVGFNCVYEKLDCAFNEKDICISKTAYLGFQNTAKSGKPCDPWNLVGLLPYDQNYCRSDGSRAPFCMVNGTAEWCFENCDGICYCTYI